MREQIPEELNLTWKAFLLEQVNAPQSRDDAWKAWEDPDFDSRDLLPHEAAISVRERLGAGAHVRYHRKLFQAHHEENRDLTDTQTLIDIGNKLDLDTSSLQKDLQEHSFRQQVGDEHMEGEQEYGIFGVPTLLFNGTQPIFLKLEEGEWEGTEDAELFNDLYDDIATRPYLLTVKKPVQAKEMPPAPARDGQSSSAS